MNTQNINSGDAMNRLHERQSLVNTILASQDANDMHAELLADLQLIAHNGVNDTTQMGDHIGGGIHVYRVTFPKRLELCLAYAFDYQPPPVIETLYHSRHQKFSFRSVAYVH